MNEFEPDYVSSPIDTLKEVLKERGMSIGEFVVTMGYARVKMLNILTGIKPIDQEIAYDLERVLDVPADFWINREREYRQAITRIEADLKVVPIDPNGKYMILVNDTDHDAVHELSRIMGEWWNGPQTFFIANNIKLIKIR